jgi:hypothetical protein
MSVAWKQDVCTAQMARLCCTVTKGATVTIKAKVDAADVGFVYMPMEVVKANTKTPYVLEGSIKQPGEDGSITLVPRALTSDLSANLAMLGVEEIHDISASGIALNPRAFVGFFAPSIPNTWLAYHTKSEGEKNLLLYQVLAPYYNVSHQMGLTWAHQEWYDQAVLFNLVASFKGADKAHLDYLSGVPEWITLNSTRLYRELGKPGCQWTVPEGNSNKFVYVRLALQVYLYEHCLPLWDACSVTLEKLSLEPRGATASGPAARQGASANSAVAPAKSGAPPAAGKGGKNAARRARRRRQPRRQPLRQARQPRRRTSPTDGSARRAQ